MKNRFQIVFFLFFPFFFCSCLSVREYVKTQKTLYEDEIAIEENYSLTLDGKVIESTSKKFYDLADVCSQINEDDAQLKMKAFTAVKESTLKSKEETITFSLMEYQANKETNEIKSFVLGTKIVKAKNGKIVNSFDSSGNSQKAKGDKFSDEMEKFFNENIDSLVNAIFAQNGAENASEADLESAKSVSTLQKSRQEIVSSEKVVVESRPNGNYIFYSIVGKPFVIVGTSLWNIIKCAGYAFYNFAGGYSAATGGEAYWKMPSFSKAREKAKAAKEANKIQYYPEYHLPFTNNHIVVDKYDRDITVVSLEDGEEITPIEHIELNNEMSVNRSASADAASTAAVAGLIGTVVTIPVSVTTWIGGAAIGIYGSAKK